MMHLGWDIAVWQSDDEGDTWFDITSSGRLMLATDGFSVSGLEEGYDYGFKIEVNGDGFLQGMSEPVFVTFDDNHEDGFLVGGDRTGRRPGGDDDVLPPVDSDDDDDNNGNDVNNGNGGNSSNDGNNGNSVNDEPDPTPTSQPSPPTPPPSQPPSIPTPTTSPTPTTTPTTIPEPTTVPEPTASQPPTTVPEQIFSPNFHEAPINDLLNEYNISNGIVILETHTLPLAQLERFAEAGLSVTFTLPLGTFTLDPDAVKSTVAAASGADITVSLTQATNLTEAQQKALSPDDLVFKITMMSGTQFISTFDGNITVTVPYTGNMPVAVWYLSNDGELDGVWFRYDRQEQTVSFMTNHLSVYVVTPITETYRDNWVFAGITAGISVIIAGVFFILWRKWEKKKI